MTNQEITKQLRELIVDQKKTIVAEWDCGHDESPVWFIINGKKVPFNDPLEELLDYVHEIIVEQLELPNAVPYTEKGSGQLVFDTQNSLYIIFENTRIEDVDEQITWKDNQIINTSKYQNKYIPLSIRCELPFIIQNIKTLPLFIDLYINSKKEIDLYESTLNDKEIKELSNVLLQHEKDRIEQEFTILEEKYLVEIRYSLELHTTFFIIKEINVLYQVITKRWENEKIILIK